MIQGFRPSRWLACAALVTAALAPAASASAGPFTLAFGSAPRTSPAAPPSPAPSDDGYRELAGSAAGVGRERPGRPAGEPANPELVVAARPLPVRPQARPTHPAPPPTPPPPAVAPSPPGQVTALGTEPNDRAADLAAHILPLGTGFALMGLGLGYLGVRLRRSI